MNRIISERNIYISFCEIETKQTNKIGLCHLLGYQLNDDMMNIEIPLSKIRIFFSCTIIISLIKTNDIKHCWRVTSIELFLVFI